MPAPAGIDQRPFAFTFDWQEDACANLIRQFFLLLFTFVFVTEPLDAMPPLQHRVAGAVQTVSFSAVKSKKVSVDSLISSCRAEICGAEEHHAHSNEWA